MRKRILSLLLAFAMLFSMVPTAFATGSDDTTETEVEAATEEVSAAVDYSADDDGDADGVISWSCVDYGSITVGQTVEISDASSYTYYSLYFTPEESGVYLFYSSGDYNIAGALNKLNCTERIASDNEHGVENNYSFTYYCIAGVTYEIESGFYDSETTGSVDVTVDWYEDASINVGEVVEISDASDEVYCYLYFTPEESGYYNFYSIGNDYVHAYLYLITEDGNKEYLTMSEIRYDEESGINNFNLLYYFEEGKIYQLHVAFGNIVGNDTCISVEAIEGTTISGTCGENATWTLDLDEGILPISGTGDMYVYYGASWIDYSQYIDFIKTVVVEEGITSLGKCAFTYFTEMTACSLPDSLTTIGTSAFRYSTSLQEITLPENLSYIGGSAFYCCYSLKEITIPDSVTKIGSQAFRECSVLEEVVLSANLPTIASSAFEECENLQKIEIPASVNCIDSSAFYWCTSLSTITFEGDAPEIGEDAFYGVTATAYYPADNSTWTDSVMQDYGGSITWCCGDADATPTDLSDATISLADTSFVYDGTAQTPAVTVVCNGETLNEGTDYEVAYADNTDAGTATVTITGIGNYTGEAKTTFVIEKSEQTVNASVAVSSLVYGGTTTITASATGDGALSYSSSDSGVVTVNSNGIVTATGGGTATITITAAATDNYAEGTATVEITVSKAAQTVSASVATGSLVYGGTTTIKDRTNGAGAVR